ncbi:uncharacterized protein [Hetaerina americana]|uniref:uncharacterized protein n=1 Tax=Hetaerina americana TaxID=62018 RepID=UPI003A7F1B13
MATISLGIRPVGHRQWQQLIQAVAGLLVLLSAREGEGHGRLMDPPARNSMWRFGFPNPVNYNDNELFCGGYAVQWEQNQGRCGLCGDPWHLSDPKPHEAGGQFAKGIIGRHYSVGQEIHIEVELTANHWGRFEMYLCPNNDPEVEATDSCFQRYPLFISGTRREVGFHIPLDTKKKETFRYSVRLPPFVTCTQCVIQWTYYTGNMWGTCPNGTEAVGCGRPETFRNCADVSIVTSSGTFPPLPPSFLLSNFLQKIQPLTDFESFAFRTPYSQANALVPFTRSDNPFLLYYRDAKRPNVVHPLIIRSQVCLGKNLYARIPGMDNWCQTNCLRYPPNCPSEICTCPETCDAVGDIANQEGADVYCQDKCIVYPSDCPKHRCSCK